MLSSPSVSYFSCAILSRVDVMKSNVCHWWRRNCWRRRQQRRTIISSSLPHHVLWFLCNGPIPPTLGSTKKMFLPLSTNHKFTTRISSVLTENKQEATRANKKSRSKSQWNGHYVVITFNLILQNNFCFCSPLPQFLLYFSHSLNVRVERRYKQ